MEKSPANHSENVENNEANDPAWDLLNQTRPVEPSAFFSRNVVREARLLSEAEEATSGGFFAWLRQPIVALAGAAAAIGIAAFMFSSDPVSTPIVDAQPAAADSLAISPSTEFADVEYLGDLMAVSDPATLTDQAFGDLF